MKYPLAEKFKSVQGEGLFTGTPMAFIRLVGCSVGKNTCNICDTDFEKTFPQLGGGLFTPEEILAFVEPYTHVCITGGEPLDRDLEPLIDVFFDLDSPVQMVHLESSGTRDPKHLRKYLISNPDESGIWLTVCPKPGYLEEMITLADEIKVIYGGLGAVPNEPGWPTLETALAWAEQGKRVYLQPRNHKFSVDASQLEEVLQVVQANPTLMMSTQFHKFLKVR